MPMADTNPFLTYARRIHKTIARHDREARKTPFRGPDPNDYDRLGRKTQAAVERDTPWIHTTKLRLVSGSYRLRDLPSILMLYAPHAMFFPLLLYGYLAGYLAHTGYFILLCGAITFMAALTKKLF